MSDKPTPHKPKGPPLSHLYSEPISMSFATSQQLAQLTSGGGSLFPNPPIPTANHSTMQMMTTGYNVHAPIYEIETIPEVSTEKVATGASAQSHSASSSGKVFKPLPSQPINLETFKGLKFVTLDGLQLETRDIYDHISGTFKWEICNSQEDRCVDFIRNECKTKRVFFISSGSLGSAIVPQIHELPQVYAIYIYCADVKRHQQWAKDYGKVRVVCDNDDKELLPQFAVDVAQANIDWGDALLKTGAHDKAKEKFQLALDKLTKYGTNHDQSMDAEINKKLQECQ